MPIRPRISGRARPENDAAVIRSLTDAIRTGEFEEAARLMHSAPDIIPRVVAIADKGNGNARLALGVYRTIHQDT